MLTLITSLALAHDCETVDFDTLAAIEAPAVVILGERHGEKVDMKRAWSLVETYAERSPTTLAMEAVHEKNQPVIDAFAKGEVKAGKLPTELDWSKTWGFKYKPYKKLVTAHRAGVTVVAAGLKLGPKPEDREIPVPEDYWDILQPMVGDHEMPPEMRARFPVSMAWRDFRVGELAKEGWNGEGYLVVLVGRGHVSGGKGTNWQLEKLVDAPVHSAILNHDEDTLCYPGDKVWAD